MKKNLSNKGFTLAELAIVIVIIGLIAGGVVVGKSIIESGKIISVVNQVTEYRAALGLFTTKYHSKPGDMSDAYAYFANGVDTVCGTDAFAPVGCNGDDDGLIEDNVNVPVGENKEESLKAWLHLNLAGFVSGSFTGLKASGSVYGKTGVNVPDSTFKNVGFMFDYSTNPVRAFLPQRDALLFGKDDATGILEGAALTPALAMAIDEKVDDGFAHRGMTVAMDGAGTTGCLDLPLVVTGDYNLTTTTDVCVLYFYTFDILNN